MAAPKHVAISLDDISEWGRKSSIGIKDACSMYFTILERLPGLQLRLKIPVLTVSLFFDAEKSLEDYMVFCSGISDFFGALSGNPNVPAGRMKVSVFGKWYNLPGKAVEAMKKTIEETKDYGNFFMNFCINYDGQEEIVDACKLIARQVELGKLTPEMVTKEMVKENIYSSYFPPPDVVLVYGGKRMTGLLLWDSANSEVVFMGKSFMEFEEGDLEKFME